MRTQRVAAAVAADLLRSRPVTAARNGLLTLIDAALEDTDQPARRAELSAAADALRISLGAVDVRDVARAFAACTGRPPREAERALTSPELTAACADALESLGCDDLAPVVRGWSRSGSGEIEIPPYTTELRERRRILAADLLRRATEIGRAIADRTAGLSWKDVPAIDGRTLKAAGGVWQRPEVTGQAYPSPQTHAARYPNRVGRIGAALAFARMRAALRSPAPDEWVTEPILLLAAVAESISPADVNDPNSRAQSMRGELAVVIREGEPDIQYLSMEHIWTTLDGWGSTHSRKAAIAPVAWNLSTQHAWADVLVWAVCSAAARLAVAAGRQIPDARLARREPTWADHLAAEWPKWNSGAQSAWLLMQSGREPLDRTAFPGHLTPVLTDPGTWPWQPEHDPWADDEPATGGDATVTPIGMR